MKDPELYLRRKRLIAIVSLVIALTIFTGITVLVIHWLRSFENDPRSFTEFIDSYGFMGRLVALGLQVLQVIISLVPGELIEIGLGVSFGYIEGTLLCMIGVALGTSLIFLVVKRWGVRLVELFIDREKIDQLRFINSEKKLKRLIFLFFFIPGTPKDLLTYFAGLTRIRLHEFLIITMIARIPSIISSTVGGNLLQTQNYVGAMWLFAVTGAVSLLGIGIYNFILSCKNKPTDKQ